MFLRLRRLLTQMSLEELKRVTEAKNGISWRDMPLTVALETELNCARIEFNKEQDAQQMKIEEIEKSSREAVIGEVDQKIKFLEQQSAAKQAIIEEIQQKFVNYESQIAQLETLVSTAHEAQTDVPSTVNSSNISFLFCVQHWRPRNLNATHSKSQTYLLRHNMDKSPRKDTNTRSDTSIWKPNHVERYKNYGIY